MLANWTTHPFLSSTELIARLRRGGDIDVDHAARLAVRLLEGGVAVVAARAAREHVVVDERAEHLFTAALFTAVPFTVLSSE